MEALKDEMTLEPYPIPEGLEGNEAVLEKGRIKQVGVHPKKDFRSSAECTVSAADGGLRCSRIEQ